MKITIPQLKNSVNRSHVTLAFLLISLACFALSPQTRPVDPPPDGGYPNQNTAEGENALFSLDTGTDNTALGFEALSQTTYEVFNTAVGSQALTNNLSFSNTAIGFDALYSNTTGSHNTAIGLNALTFNTTG